MILSLNLISCADDDELITTDISVTAAETFISWVDQVDLVQKLDQTLVYNFGRALESEIEKELLFNTDTTLAVARVSFKVAFQDKYYDSDFSNNFVNIILEQDLNLGAIELRADGPGDTYELITSVLEPGANPIETPDCNHAEFGDHIDEVFDNELNINVFQFYIHVEPDNDRCIIFD